MKRSLLLGALLCLHFFTSLKAQQNNSLKIGDDIPNNVVELLASFDRDPPAACTVNDPLILLDFWATWCSSCIKKFPLLDSLQQTYSPQLQVFLVNSTKTKDDSSKIQKFFSKWKNFEGLSNRLPVLINDTLLQSLFPHVSIPHVVWLYHNKVIAITHGNAVTPENIKAVLENKEVSMELKDDSRFFRKKEQ